MKTLLLLRHGKAQPDAPHGDRERSLTERGRRDSVAIGRKMASIVPVLDAVVASDARRAVQTANIATSSAGYTGPVTEEPEIYEGGLDELIDIVRSLPDTANRVLLVGHNPGFEELAAALAQEGTPAPHLSTAAIAHLEFDAPTWRSARPGNGRLVGVYTAGE